MDEEPAPDNHFGGGEYGGVQGPFVGTPYDEVSTSEDTAMVALRAAPLPILLPWFLDSTVERGEELGEGGFGRVFRATVTGGGPGVPPGTSVAVKMLEGADQEKIARDLDREAMFMVRAAHEGTLRVHGMLVADDDPGRSIGIVMELAGQSMRKWIKSREGSGSPPVPGQVELMLVTPACALACAHSRLVLHGDVKPDNVLAARDQSRLLLGDWGIGQCLRLAKHEGKAPTFEGTVRGLCTRFYAAPEVYYEGASTAASDVWSFAATAFHMVFGKTPYKSGGLHRAMENREPPVIPDTCTPGLRALLEDCFQFDATLRPGMVEVARRLAALSREP
jgi:serine/threonine protein kinase